MQYGKAFVITITDADCYVINGTVVSWLIGVSETHTVLQNRDSNGKLKKDTVQDNRRLDHKRLSWLKKRF